MKSKEQPRLRMFAGPNGSGKSTIKANLKPNLKVYVEWSNETWNMGFEQAKYAAQQGIVMNLPGDDYSKLGGYQAISAIKCW